jgi:putative transposase
MQRKTEFAEGEYYHLYNRGVEKRDIFLDTRDYNRFQALLYLSNDSDRTHTQNAFANGHTQEQIFSLERETPLVAIGAYCLMPNHFHLLVKEIREGGISLFMKKLGTAYAMYFNARRSRTGSLFEGPFRSVHQSEDRQLRYLFAYIHLNPAKLIDPGWKEGKIKDTKRLRDYLTNYSFSSYPDYLGKGRPQKSIVSRGEFPDYFPTITDVSSMIEEWLEEGE